MAASRRSKPSRSGGLGQFFLGILVGAVATAFWFGFIQDRPTNIGAGIDTLLDAAKKRAAHEQSQGQPADSLSQSLPEIEYSYHERLLNDSYVPPLPSPSQPPAQDTAAEPQAATAPPPAPPAPAESYVLQVGSFADYKSADGVKGTLALSGIVAFIQKVTVEGEGDFYRVRVGPFHQFDVMQAMVTELVGLGYKPLRFRVENKG